MIEIITYLLICLFIGFVNICQKKKAQSPCFFLVSMPLWLFSYHGDAEEIDR